MKSIPIRIGTIRQNASQKYDAWNLELSCNVTIAKEYEHPRIIKGNTLYYDKATSIGTIGVKGTIVFTGQPSARDPGKNGSKHMEFIFHSDASAKVNLSSRLRTDFITIHSDASGKPNKEWKFWSTILEGNGNL